MIYKPKELYNPTDEVIKFVVGGVNYHVDAHDSDLFDGFVAHQVLEHQHSGLVEKEKEVEKAEPVKVEKKAKKKPAASKKKEAEVAEKVEAVDGEAD